MYKLAVFDMDGTILNTFNVISSSVNAMRGHFGLGALSDTTIRKLIGLDFDTFLARAVPEIAIDNPSEWRRIREQYANDNVASSAPYQGVVAMLESLQSKGVRLAVLTNKNIVTAKAECKRYFDGINFEIVKGDCSGFVRKPAGDELVDIIDTLGATKQQTVFVGDSEIDVMCASNAGVDCIAVLWGFRTKEELVSSGATVLVDSASDVYDIITK